MLRHRLGLGCAVTVMATAVVACQSGTTPSLQPGGEMSMQVRWPMRVQAIPPNTAVVAVGVFKDGQLIPTGSFRVGILSRGAGTLRYSGLPNGDYRVVAGAFDKDARPLAGGSGSGTINLQVAPRTQVRLDLRPGDPAGELSPYLSDIQRYLAGLSPSPEPTPTPQQTAQPTTDPNAGTTSSPAPTTATSPTTTTSPAPTSTSSPATGGGGGGGTTVPSTTTTVTFSGGFQ